MNAETLAAVINFGAVFGPWALAALAVYSLTRLFMDRGYSIKVDIGPKNAPKH